MKVIKSDNKYSLSTAVEILDKLPIGNYNFNWNAKEGCFLIQKEPFILPDKIYGDLEVAHRALKKWNATTSNLGVYLVGQSGSGKTLTGKYIAKNSNVPVIFITNSDFEMADFSEFLSSLEQDVCFFFDEWEKIFERQEQDAFLSILDGLFNSQYKKLFLFTSNEDRMSIYMTNRPSRIFYKQKYSYITPLIVNEIISDIHLEEVYANSLKSLLEEYDYQLNIDTVFSIISEMKLHNETADKVIPYFNFELPELAYSVVFIDDKGEKHEVNSYFKTSFQERAGMELYLDAKSLKDTEYYCEYFRVHSKKKTNNGYEAFCTFSRYEGCKLIFNKIKTITTSNSHEILA